MVAQSVYGHVITKFSWMGRLLHFLTYGALLARFVRKSSGIKTFIWRKALTSIQHLPYSESNGWVRASPSLKPVYMTKEPAPSTCWN